MRVLGKTRAGNDVEAIPATPKLLQEAELATWNLGACLRPDESRFSTGADADLSSHLVASVDVDCIRVRGSEAGAQLRAVFLRKLLRLASPVTRNAGLFRRPYSRSQ